MAASSSSSFSAFASLSRRFLSRSPALSLRRPLLLPSAARFFSTPIIPDDQSDSEEPAPGSGETASPSSATGETAAGETPQQRLPFQRPLENGLDQGVYKAILVGKVGQQPVQKYLRSGRTVVLFSLGTGGIRNNRRPLDNEEPRDYAERCAVQWHRVGVYPDRLSNLVLKHVKPGLLLSYMETRLQVMEFTFLLARSILYLEGNLETKVFSDPVTGIVRRIREIALRRDARLVFLDNVSKAADAEPGSIKNVGYY